MKNAGSPLITYLATTTNLLFADLWTIVLVNGVTVNYTNWDVDLKVGSVTYQADDVIVDGAEIDWTYGLQANSTDVTAYPSPLSIVGGVPFLTACAYGQFDRANITRLRLFMPTPGDASLGAVTLFQGQITEVEATRYTAKLSCKDAKNLLNIYMPRRQFQPTCSWVFGDANCGFDRTSTAVTAAVTAGSSGSLLLASALTQVAGFFNNGTVKFTSGVNSGISRSIKNFSPGTVTLVAPFPQQAAVGDAFTIMQGCTKSFAGPTTSVNAAAATGTTADVIQNGDGSSPGAYNGDSIVFTSGGNNGLSRVIQSWSPQVATLMTPFPNAPAIGDSFNIVDPSGNVLTSNSVANPLSSVVIPTALNFSDGFFTGGTLMFTSGGNVGQTQTVASWQANIATMASGFGTTPAIGDEFTITSAPGATQGTCTGYFGANAPLHFGGERFIPVPETAY